METPHIQFNKNSEERRRRRTKFLFMGILFAIAVLVGIIAFLRKPSLQVTLITVEGTRTLDTEAIHQAALKNISGTYAFVIPKSNILLFSKKSMRTALMNQFTALENVQVAFSERQHIVLTISERKAESIWCREVSAPECYFIDNQGMMYDRAPAFSEGVYLTFTGSTREVSENPLKQRFISLVEFANLMKFVHTLEQDNAQVSSVDLMSSGDIVFAITQLRETVFAQKAKIMISPKTSPMNLTEAIRFLFENKQFVNALVNEKQQLESIDVRFTDKVYFKFAGSGASTESSASSTTVSASSTPAH